MAHQVTSLCPEARHQSGRAGSPGLLSRIVAAMTVARERRALSRLDDHLLRDIGLTRATAEEEASRAPWDVPEGWRR